MFGFFILKNPKIMEHKNIQDYFTEEVVAQIKSSIKDADGNEVFFAGKINEKGVVDSVVAAAKGNSHSVPVNFAEARKGHVLIHNHPSGNLVPSDADINVASVASENTQGFYIINNECSEIYVVVKPVVQKTVSYLDVEEAGNYISNGGPLAASSDDFEERPVQIKKSGTNCYFYRNNKFAAAAL